MSEPAQNVRKRIIAALDYPKLLMDEDVKQLACSYQHLFLKEQEECVECLYILECECSSNQLELSRLQGYTLPDLSRMLQFAVEYVSYHSRRDGHSEQQCGCELCGWLQQAGLLLAEASQ